MDKQTATQKGCVLFSQFLLLHFIHSVCWPVAIYCRLRSVSFSQSDVTVVSGEQGLITLNYYDNSNPYQSWARFPNTNIDMTKVNPVRCGQGFGLPNTISILT